MTRKKKIFAVALTLCAIFVMAYLYLATIATDEAQQADEVQVTRSVVQALQDSVRQTDAMRQLILDEQARTDSVAKIEADQAAETDKLARVDFLWRVFNEAHRATRQDKQAEVFAKYATQHFKTFLKQRKPSLYELLLFPLDDLSATSIWHFQQDWYAVSTSNVGIYVLRVVRQEQHYLIDDIQQASRPAEDDALSDDAGGLDDY